MTTPSINELLHIEVELGVAARTFLESDAGLTCISRRDREIADLQAEFEDLRTKPERLLDIRLDIAVRRRALDWLLETITQADIAHQQLELSDSEE
jgi:hypothetical protein